MVDAIVTLRLRPEICGWNRNYFYVEEQQDCMKRFCSVKPLLKSPELVHLYGNYLLSCAEIFHQKEPKFWLKHDAQKSFLICKGKPMKDFCLSSPLKYTYFPSLK